LVAAGTKSPAAILGRRPIAGEQHHSDIGLRAGVIQGSVELVNCLRAEGVSNLGTRKSNPHNPKLIVAVVTNIG
jgi:hypothetical protein